MTSLHRSFFERSVLEVAKDLIGATLVFDEVGAVIVETEAYLLDAPASHSFKGVTHRNGSMFGRSTRQGIYLSILRPSLVPKCGLLTRFGRTH
jgi:DNA-3-methyladenine glycosylase